MLFNATNEEQFYQAPSTRNKEDIKTTFRSPVGYTHPRFHEHNKINFKAYQTSKDMPRV